MMTNPETVSTAVQHILQPTNEGTFFHDLDAWCNFMHMCLSATQSGKKARQFGKIMSVCVSSCNIYLSLCSLLYSVVAKFVKIIGLPEC